MQVVTGNPNYPKGTFYPGFDGVKIHRCPIHPRKSGPVHRLWNYVSYPAAASRYLRSKEFASENGGKFDIVFIYQLSPVLMASPGIRYARKHRIPVLLYCLDLWPESLLAGGVRRGSVLYRYFHRVSGRIYRAADKLLITSGQFSEYLNSEFSIPEARIAYLPQYAEDLFSQLPPRKTDGGAELLFAGNLGAMQSLDTILDAAALLRDTPVRISIAGDGSVYEHLVQRINNEGLSNVRLLGRRPVEEMPALYQSADALLVTLKKDPVLSMTLPGKVQSYLAAGRPVIGAIDGETARVIEDAGCGFCGPAEDAAALAENIHRFLSLRSPQELGRRAAVYYASHFSKAGFFEGLDAALKEFVPESEA